VPPASAILVGTALAPGATHSLLAATARLVVLPFAATMAAPSPVAGVLRLVRSFIHRRPVGASIEAARYAQCSPVALLFSRVLRPLCADAEVNSLALPASGLYSECGSSGFARDLDYGNRSRSIQRSNALRL
jgi:hypothetical protein